MSIVNRRNAFMGWAVWTIGKQVMKRKAMAAAAVDDGRPRRSRLALGLGAAAAATATTLFFWRRRGDVEDGVEPLG